MIELIHHFLKDKAAITSQSEPVTGRYYQRTGACNQCGKCCKNIYLVHADKAIQDEAEFERLKAQHREYESFVPLEETEHGLTFRCTHLTPQNTCADYENRPDFCRKYPSERGILLGGNLAEGCGYRFTLLQTFSEVLAKVNQKASQQKPPF